MPAIVLLMLACDQDKLTKYYSLVFLSSGFKNLLTDDERGGF